MKPKTAKEAEEIGEMFYRTGKPCKNGHTAERYTTSRACIMCSSKWSKAYAASPVGREKAKYKALLRNYGLTKEAFTSLQMQHENKCAICIKPTKLVVDHDHTTGKIRGMLCDSCNKALGLFKDNTAYLSSAIKYLRKTNDTNDNDS